MENKNTELSPELESIQKSLFGSLSVEDFLSFWQLGEEKEVSQGHLTRQNEVQKTLCFLLEGTALVFKGGDYITSVPPHHFIGEMSFLTGNPASADVEPKGKVRIQEWDQEKIRTLREAKPLVFSTLLGVLGVDVSKKLSGLN